MGDKQFYGEQKVLGIFISSPTKLVFFLGEKGHKNTILKPTGQKYSARKEKTQICFDKFM